MYSQNDEEKWILEYYGEFKGRFLDIGAHNGTDLSNTRALVNLGWCGVSVEPSPIVFSELLRLYQQNNNIEVVNCAVDVESKLKFFFDNDGGYVSTISKKHQEYFSREHGSIYRGMYLKTIKIEELLECFGYDFNFLNFDIEGIDLEVLETFPFEKLLNLNLLCLEHGNKPNEILGLLNKYGFVFLAKTRENIILKKT